MMSGKLFYFAEIYMVGGLKFPQSLLANEVVIQAFLVHILGELKSWGIEILGDFPKVSPEMPR